MAALPQSNTTRWWAVYTVNNATHRMGVRTAVGVTAVQMNTVFNTFFTNITAILNSLAVQNLEFALLGSNVRNTAAWTGPASYGTGSQASTDVRARCYSWVGRSPDGRKSKLFVFGTKDIGEGDYRVDTTESAAVASEVTYLNAASGVFLSISGAQPVWKGYANINYNEHWIKQFRKLGG